MANWLIVYNRPAGELLRCEEFSDSREAIRERFAVERANRGNHDLEIVVLGGDSLDTLKATHGRYFYTVRELLERFYPHPANNESEG